MSKLVSAVWDDGVIAQIDACLSRAAAGQPTVLVIQGDPGLGKSTLLAEVLDRSASFRALTGEGLDLGADTPYDLLAQLGVDAGDAEVISPTLAAQRLRTVVDQAAVQSPVCIVVDDLQWVDAESVQALVALMRRAAGDRLLLCVATRPLEAGRHPEWQRWVARPGRTETITLSGLTEPQAIALVRALRPDISAGLAHDVWSHTSGNPLYLRALVSEYDADELTGMRVLPAPADYAHTIAVQLQRMSSDGQAFARALAVLGDGWQLARDVAAVAATPDAAPDVAAAVQECRTAGLVGSRPGAAGEQVRMAHPLLRAAVYQHIPLEQRRAMHHRAAAVLPGTPVVLQHRLAAADEYDDELAAELEHHASELHARRSYRQSADYLAAAGSVSSEPQARERRRLDALFATLLSGDLDTVERARDEIVEASDPRFRDLLLGALAVWQRRPFDAVPILAARSGGPADATQYRIEAALAWARLMAGAPDADIADALGRAAALPIKDPALERLAALVAGQLAGRRIDNPDELPHLSELPGDPAAVPARATELLAWRGAVRSSTGRFASGIADLAEVIDRMHRGLYDYGAGAFHALLARAQWFLGDWATTRVNLGLAGELAGARGHPIVQAVLPLLAVGDGRIAEADEQLDIARRAVERTPWTEAFDILTVTDIVRAHATASPLATGYGPIHAALRELAQRKARKTVVWHAHVALASIWAGELDDARSCAAMVADRQVGWAGDISEWLYGLIAEADGDGAAAMAHVRRAAAGELVDLPLYRAHIHVDFARIAYLVGDRAGADRALDHAVQGYRKLGAQGYLERVLALQHAHEPAAPAPTGYGLSDRERDVITLLANGMSYVQIARDLFITRSTVSYHLGNIYAKTNTASRHELTQLVHADPAAFGKTA